MVRKFIWSAIALLAVNGASAATPCDFSQGEPVLAVDATIAKKAETIFSKNCATCHGLGKAGGANVMTDILDRDAVLRDDMVDLKNPEKSRIFAAIGAGPDARKSRIMPLQSPPLSDVDKQSILDWIKAGAPNWAANVVVNDPTLTHRQERECIRYDQAKFAVTNGEKSLYYLRYLTVGHLAGKEFTFTRDGALKMVQLLSRTGQGPKDGKTRYADSYGKILRIDTRDFEPTFSADVWEKVVIPGYPYAYVPLYDKLLNDVTNDVNRAAYSEWAFVRADFFIARVTENKVYKKIIGLPDTLDEFEKKQLNIDVAKELDYGYAKRGSVAKSGVTHQPRFVDRFNLDIYSNGAFHSTQHWITRDFNSDKARRNIYAFPAGPASLLKYLGWTEAQYFQAKVFQNDASESITGKGDGFDIYAIWNGQGKNLDEADPKIAIDRSGLFDDDIVRNPLGCIRCHAGGSNQFNDDTVIDHIKGSPAFTMQEVDDFERIFFKPQERATAFASHANQFKAAMDSLGLKDPNYLTPGGEPTSAAFVKFNAWITCTDLARELGISELRLTNTLHHSPDLARQLGMGDCKTGKLSRANYVHLFPQLVKDFNIGLALKIGGNGYVAPVVKCYSAYSNASAYAVRFTVGGLAHELYQNKSVTIQYDVNQQVNLQAYLGWDQYHKPYWYTQANSWTATACKNYQFKLNGDGRVVLFEK